VLVPFATRELSDDDGRNPAELADLIQVRRSRSSGTAPVVSPESTCKNRSAVNRATEGLPNIVRLGP
jgi:hypothetical protein